MDPGTENDNISLLHGPGSQRIGRGDGDDRDDIAGLAPAQVVDTQQDIVIIVVLVQESVQVDQHLGEGVGKVVAEVDNVVREPERCITKIEYNTAYNTTTHT